MANQGVRGFYQLTQTIKRELLLDKNINTVTTGDITDVNLNKQDIFPLGHIISNADMQDILNTQLAVLNLLIQKLRMGTLYTNKYQLDGNPNLTPFYDRFENQLAGWSATMDVMIYNDIRIC
mgnify:CR=1 FL=1